MPTDIRHLVDRIARALGPDVSPERVEAVAVAALDALDDAPAVSTPADEDHRVVLTAYGHDHPGILAALTQDLADAQVNILDVSQKIMRGYFTVIMLIDGASMRGSLRDLQRRLTTTGERHGVRVHVQHEALFTAMHRV